MLKIIPPDYRFCPFCGKKLELKTEGVKERKFCTACNWVYYPHVATAVAAIIVRENKVLMVKRAKEPYRDTWMFPAGFVEFGEHPVDSLKRETVEETGLQVGDSHLVGIWQTDDDPRSSGHFCLFYLVSALGEKITTDHEENQSINWFEIKNPPRIGWKSHQYIMQLLKEGKV